MSGGKTAAYTDAVNKIARENMLRDLQGALDPIRDTMDLMHKSIIAMVGRMAELEKRIKTLEDNQPHPNQWQEGGSDIPQDPDAP